MQAAFIFKNNREKSYQVMVLILVIIHFIFFVLLLINGVMRISAIAGLAAITCNGVYKLWFSKLSGRKFYFSKDIFFFFGILFSSTELWWLLFIEVGFSIIFSFYFQVKTISFSPFLIEYRARPHKRYKWDEFSNIILKDNFLTLDFKNNKLFQVEIEDTTIDQDKFNAFAKAQLQNS